MAGETANQDASSTPGRHIELVTDDSKDDKNGADGTEPSSALTNGKGWDGKLRIPGRVSLANPEALSDPEYSDEENVVPGDEIQPDEGTALSHLRFALLLCCWVLTPRLLRSFRRRGPRHRRTHFHKLTHTVNPLPTP